MDNIYSIAIVCYYYFILIASIFNKKAKLWIAGRRNWKTNLIEKHPKEKHWIWFHCASLGEFEDCCEVFFKIKSENPSKSTILTVFSPTAYEILKHSDLFDIITYLPLDTKRNAKAFLEIIKPELALFSRSEIWPNFLKEMQHKNIPVFLISLGLTSKSSFIKFPARLFYKKYFQSFAHIFCQNEATQKLIRQHFNITSSSITGNTRFGRIYNQSQTNSSFQDIERFIGNHQVIVWGSCLPKDENMFLEVYENLASLPIKWILVPHEPQKSIIPQSIKTDNLILYSNIKSLQSSHDILVIDSVGILKYLYKFADFAIIGGGFDRIGIHNILEPAAFGVQTAFGPNHRNYEEAIELIRLGGAFVYKNSKELTLLLREKLSKPSILKEEIKQYVIGKVPDNTQIITCIQQKDYLPLTH